MAIDVDGAPQAQQSDRRSPFEFAGRTSADGGDQSHRRSSIDCATGASPTPLGKQPHSEGSAADIILGIVDTNFNACGSTLGTINTSGGEQNR